MQYSVREMRKLLKENGYHRKRTKGSHEIYDTGSTIISLPVVTLNYKIANRFASQILKN